MPVPDAAVASPAADTRGLRGRSFRLLLVGTAATFSGFALLLPLVPLWAVQGGAGETGAGATTGVFMLTTVATQLGMPWLLRRAGHRASLVAGAVLLGAPAPLYAVSAALAPLLAVSAVRGVGFGMVTVCGSAIVAELVPAAQRGRGAARYGLAVGLASLGALPAGVWVAGQLGYGVVFAVAGALPVLGAGAALGVRVPGAAGVDGAKRPVLRGLLGPWLVMVSASLAGGGLVTFVPLVMAGAAGASSVGLLAYGAAGIGSRWAAGALGDRAGRAVLLVAGVLLAVAGMLAIALAAAGGPGDLGLAVAGSALFGAGFGAVQNDTLVAMFDRAGPGGHGTASAAWNMAFDAGTGLGAVALGLLVDGFGFVAAFVAAGAALAVCLPPAVWTARGRLAQ